MVRKQLTAISSGTGCDKTIGNIQQLALDLNPYGIAGTTVINQEWQNFIPFNVQNFVFTDVASGIKLLGGLPQLPNILDPECSLQIRRRHAHSCSIFQMDGARTSEHRCNSVRRLEPGESYRLATNFAERISSHGVSGVHKHRGQAA